MAHNCLASHSIPMSTTPSNSSLTISTRIPFSFDFRVDICPTTHLSNADNNTNEIPPPPLKSNCETGAHEFCVHGCKERLIQILVNEPHRIQFRPFGYKRRSKFANEINENFSEILVDGVLNTHLAMCRCKRLIARYAPLERNLQIHLGSLIHSKYTGVESYCEHSIENSNEEVGTGESFPRTQSPTPSLISYISDDDYFRGRSPMEPSTPESPNVTQEFLQRKYKLEALLKLEPRLFLFMPAYSIPTSRVTAPGVFRECAIPGFQTEDLIVCTSCSSILNNYPNNIWNVKTHQATHSHYENMSEGRGFRVKNFDFNFVKSE